MLYANYGKDASQNGVTYHVKPSTFISLHHVIISPRLQEYKYTVLQQQQEYDRLTSLHGHWAGEKSMLFDATQESLH